MYSLWRGGKLLGHFAERGPVMHHGRRAGAFGILLPTGLLGELSSVMQTQVEMLPDSPTFQHPLPIEWVGLSPPPRPVRNSGPVALEPMSAEAARGVPANQVYEIRDDRGARINTRLITLRLNRLADGVDAQKWWAADALEGDSREVWIVTFASPPPNGKA